MGKEIQRALLWVILFTSCFLLWDNYQVYKGGQSFFQNEAVQQQNSADQSVPTTKAPTSGDVAASIPAPQLKDPVVVTTDRMKVTFDREGAVIVSN